MRSIVLAVTFMSLLGVGIAVAQQSDEAYWNEPGPIVKDDAGHITYQEIRDSKNFTVRVFTNGVWLTQRYQPHTRQLVRVEAPDTTEEPVYEQGKIAGLRVRVNGVTLNVHSERDAILGLPGSDQIRVEKDQTSRATAVRRGDGTDAARFTFDDEGYLRRALIGTLSLQLSAPAVDGAVTETLTDATGKIVTTVTVPGDKLGKHVLGACLDPVRSLAGLGDNWPSTVAFKRSATATVTTVTNPAGRVLLYIVNYGANRFGFDAAGKPLFIDAKLDLAGASLLPDGDKGAIAAQRQSAVAPTRVVVTADGHVGACVEGAGPGAIASFWTERGADGHELVRYRTIGKATIQPKMQAAPQGTSYSKRLMPARDGFYVCDTTTVETTDSITGQTVITTTDILCPTYETGGGGTSGGGGTAYASNTISGDPTLANQVSNAIAAAQQKLTKCASQLLALPAANSTATNPLTLRDWLAAKSGLSMQYFMTSGSGQVFVMDTTANPNGICAAGYPAYTNLYQNTTYVCENQFRSLTAFDQWVRLIHEELHALGYAEQSKTFPNAPTPAQISAMVAQMCN